MPSDAADLAARLDRIQQLTDELARAHADALAQQAIAERIHREIQIVKQGLRPLSLVDPPD